MRYQCLFLTAVFCLVFSVAQAEVMCTMDAKICPDGTGVGRTGPNCEFAPCPETTEDAADPPATSETSEDSQDSPKPATPAPVLEKTEGN